jgi:bifunctional DNase/RNase
VDVVELKVAEIRVTGADSPPVVVLTELDGAGRQLPIWMSHGGAAAILAATEDPDELRPSIHDVTGQLLGAGSDLNLTSIRLTGGEDGQFFAELVLPTRVVPARPSDAIALALRVHCPITCTEELLAEFGVAAHAAPAVPGEDEVERFIEFLDKVTPEDFSGDDSQP